MIYHYILNLPSQRLYFTVMSHTEFLSLFVVAANVLKHIYSGASEIVPERSRVIITCELEGNPSPSVIWRDNRAGAVIQSGMSQNGQSSLAIERADCLNTTTFTVYVNNSRGSNTHHVGLNVTCKLNRILIVLAVHKIAIFYISRQLKKTVNFIRFNITKTLPFLWSQCRAFFWPCYGQTRPNSYLFITIFA